jgi:CRISPR-associated endonuclease Cas1
MQEARIAAIYWSILVGIPIQWERSAMEKIPLHWHKVPERVSGISSSHTAQHATNPFHATLNFAYALLKAQVLQSILIHGLDETIGFLHASREGGQPLVYDLMEPFRSPVDERVLDIFDKTVFKKGDFIQTTTGECHLNEGLRKYIVAKCRVPNREIDTFVERIMDYFL